MCSGLGEVVKSNDTFFDGALQCLQHREGYRFSMDSVLLAHFVCLNDEERVLDLGAGCGVIGLILLYRYSAHISSLTAFELQDGLAALIHENIDRNGFQKQMKLIQGDLQDISNYLQAEAFSTVVCNPPFYPPGSGRQSKNREAEIARHQVCCNMKDVVRAAAFAVKNRGRVAMIYPADGVATIVSLLTEKGLSVKRMQFVYSYPDPLMGASLVLLESVKNGGDGVTVLPPFYMYERKNGSYSKEMERFYDPC